MDCLDIFCKQRYIFLKSANVNSIQLSYSPASGGGGVEVDESLFQDLDDLELDEDD